MEQEDNSKFATYEFQIYCYLLNSLYPLNLINMNKYNLNLKLMTELLAYFATGLAFYTRKLGRVISPKTLVKTVRAVDFDYLLFKQQYLREKINKFI